MELKTDEKLKKGMWQMGKKYIIKALSKCNKKCDHCKETDNGC